MQEQELKHPVQINLSSVIALTRGFLKNAFQSFLKEGKYAE